MNVQFCRAAEARLAIQAGSFLLLAVASFAVPAQALMKGDYSVTARGAATYRIPITLQDIIVIWGEGVLTDTPNSEPQLLNINICFNVDGMGKYRRAKWISNCNLNATLPQSSPPPYFRILSIADIDGNGRPDIVVAQNVNNDCDRCVQSNLMLWTFHNTGMFSTSTSTPQSST